MLEIEAAQAELQDCKNQKRNICTKDGNVCESTKTLTFIAG